jgi:chorismate mutase / prephenate dehydrogenase
MNNTPKLDSLRHEIGQVDRDIITLIARRLELAEEVGQIKMDQQLPIKNYQVEKQVIARNRSFAESLGSIPELAEDLSKLLIQYAVATQDENHSRWRRKKDSEQQSILILGGLGRMGQWLAKFFDSFDHHVCLYDTSTSANQSRFECISDLDQALAAATVIVFATPILETQELLAAIIEKRPAALIFDICSLKSPLLDPLSEARRKGLRVSSIHPMFGPDIQLLAGQNILICDCGHSEATASARALFEDTTANLIDLTVAQHDEFVGNVLGLSHLTNLIFAHALSQSGISFKELQRVGSTTFNAQQSVSEQVVNENQDLYYEIQAENNATGKIIERLHSSIEQFSMAIKARDRNKFKELMDLSRRYFE